MKLEHLNGLIAYCVEQRNAPIKQQHTSRLPPPLQLLELEFFECWVMDVAINDIIMASINVCSD